MIDRLLLADILSPELEGISPVVWDVLLVGGLVVVLVLVLFIVTAITRRKRRRRRHHGPEILRNSKEHLRQMAEAQQAGEPSPRQRKRRRKRRRHGDHYPSRPTLAESGGLPPRRDKNSASDSGS